MLHRIALWSLTALLLLCGSGVAQIATPSSIATATAVPETAVPPPPSVDELNRLVRTLQDDKGRAELVGQLQALIAAQRAADPNGVRSADLLEDLSGRLNAVTEEL